MRERRQQFMAATGAYWDSESGFGYPLLRSICIGLGLTLVAYPVACNAHIEVDADPIAYIEHGYSLHAAQTIGAADRIQLGLFALDVPGFALDNRDFAVRDIHGMTLKL